MAEEPERDRSHRLEQVKLVFDLHKQLITLSVAVLVLALAADRGGFDMNLGLGSILLSSCALTSLTGLVGCIMAAGWAEDEEWWKHIGALIVFATPVGAVVLLLLGVLTIVLPATP